MNYAEAALKTLRSLSRSMIEVPNNWLPEEYQNKKTGGRTLAELQSIYNKKNTIKNKKTNEKNERLSRIEKYRQQFEASGCDENFEISFDNPNNDQLYRNQMAFCSAMMRAGQIDEI